MTLKTIRALSITDIDFPLSVTDIETLKTHPLTNDQDRMEQALRLAIETPDDGYNIFVAGEYHVEKKHFLVSILKDYNQNSATLQDIAYVFNFNDPAKPRALFFPIHEAAVFARALRETLHRIYKTNIHIAQSDIFFKRKKMLSAELAQYKKKQIQIFMTEMKEYGFTAQYDDNGLVDFSIEVDGEDYLLTDVLSECTALKCNREKLVQLEKDYKKGIAAFSLIEADILRREAELTTHIGQIAKDIIRTEIKSAFIPLMERVISYSKKNIALEDIKKIRRFLRQCQIDLYRRAAVYRKPFANKKKKKAFFNRYAMNIVYSAARNAEMIVHECNPSFEHVFGTVDARSQDDNTTDYRHLLILPGSLHRALNGFFIVNIHELLQEEETWQHLKYCLQTKTLINELLPSGSQSSSVFCPEPLPLQCTVILLGNEYEYETLFEKDKDFFSLFKVYGEFDSFLPYSNETVANLISRCRQFAHDHGYVPIDNSGFVQLIKYAAQCSGSKHFLTTQFSRVSNVIAEAHVRAKKQKSSVITGDHVNNVIEHRRYLHALPREKLADEIRLGEILIHVTGTAIGTINGLAVQDYGHSSLGIPTVITAQASPGTAGLMSIEREAGLGEEIYNKAHLIISSLLRKKYANDFPLSLSASICFEQSYGHLDGDSASCGEFCCLVSAIGEIPLRQDIAITGSLNQHGFVQPIGDASEKIEGFFHACSILGFTGTQGVIIPYASMHTLFLPKEIERAIEQQQFFIWSITHIDQAIALLTGMSGDAVKKIVRKRLLAFEKRVKLLNNSK